MAASGDDGVAASGGGLDADLCRRLACRQRLTFGQDRRHTLSFGGRQSIEAHQDAAQSVSRQWPAWEAWDVACARDEPDAEDDAKNDDDDDIIAAVGGTAHAILHSRLWKQTAVKSSLAGLFLELRRAHLDSKQAVTRVGARLAEMFWARYGPRAPSHDIAIFSWRGRCQLSYELK